MHKFVFFPYRDGELRMGFSHPEDAPEHFVAALKLARNPRERSFFEHRIDACR